MECRRITIIHTNWTQFYSIFYRYKRFRSKYHKSSDQPCLYSHHISPSNRVWYHLYLYEELPLPRCSGAKVFGLRASLVRWWCLSNSQRTPALKSITNRKNIPWSRELPSGKKNLISCCGTYLQECGTGSVFVENEIFGPGVVQSALSGGHNVRGKKDLMMLAETLQQLCSSKNIYAPTQDHLQDSQHIEAFKTMLTNASTNESAEWKYHEVKMKGLIHSIGDFNNAGCQKSNQFKFWCVFLQDVVSFLIATNRSHREGNWDMLLSAVRRAIPLFLFLNRINYKHWVPLYFGDCMALKSRFPDLWENFCNGGIVVHKTLRKGSGIPMDQALEKQYNKPAKDPSGVIGFTKRKQAVCKWNIIKHEKLLFTEGRTKICALEAKINILSVMMVKRWSATLMREETRLTFQWQ